jgi:hypothetical protein
MQYIFGIIFRINHLEFLQSRYLVVPVKGTTAILQRCRVWGCPAYVLAPTLQEGKKIPIWHPRARRGVFLGFSTLHSSTVGLILNPSTGHVSAQYHIVYDE